MRTEHSASSIEDLGRGPLSFTRANRSLVAAIKGFVDPVVILLCLTLVFWAYGQPLRGKFLILALLTFLLTYPGQLRFRSRNFQLLGEIVARWTLTAMTLLAVGYLSDSLDSFDARAVIAWMLAAPLAVWAVHLASPWALPRILPPSHREKAAVVGASTIGARLASIINTHSIETRVIAFFDDRAAERRHATNVAPCAGRLSDVASKVRENGISIIYIALPMSSQPRLLALLDELRDTTCSIYFVPDVFVFDLIQARVDSVGEVPVLAICESPFRGVEGLLKRWSDIVIALLALIVSAPFALFVAIAIKLDSPGPVFFRQRRLGLNGREIVVWKFRTMRVTEDSGEIRQATVHDDRVTPVGRFLRRTSLDELPQFINVLQGTMSVVGPRPHALAHDAIYRELIKGYVRRHKIKPGITGWAQVNGARGETQTLEKMARRIELDMYYLRNWSLKLDIIIIARTIGRILHDPNAY